MRVKLNYKLKLNVVSLEISDSKKNLLLINFNFRRRV